MFNWDYFLALSPKFNFTHFILKYSTDNHYRRNRQKGEKNEIKEIHPPTLSPGFDLISYIWFIVESIDRMKCQKPDLF